MSLSAFLGSSEPSSSSPLALVACVVDIYRTTQNFSLGLPHLRCGVPWNHRAVPERSSRTPRSSSAPPWISHSIGHPSPTPCSSSELALGLSRDVFFTELSPKEPPWICRLFVLLHDFVEFCRIFCVSRLRVSSSTFLCPCELSKAIFQEIQGFSPDLFSFREPSEISLHGNPHPSCASAAPSDFFTWAFVTDVVNSQEPPWVSHLDILRSRC